MTGLVRGTQLARLLAGWRSPRSGAGRVPEYAALAAAIRSLLRDGRLGLGVRLPAERELAGTLSVSRATITAAYRELRESGHLASRRGAGSWTALPEGQRITASGLWSPVDAANLLDLSCAVFPAPEQLPEAAAAAVADLPRYSGTAGYQPAGLTALREAVAEGYEARGLPTRADQILITTGVQHAADLVFRLVLSPGQSVLVESPTYPNMLTNLRSQRARLGGVALDRESGWDAEAMLTAIRSGRPAMAYLIPEFHNPTGHAMPQALRERLPAAAHAAGTDLVVDESFVELWIDAEPAPPVAAFDRHARVFTIGGMSKPYWGGLRVGWVRAPASVIARLTALRVAVDMGNPVLDQLLALRLLHCADTILKERRDQLRRQRDVIVSALGHRIPEWSFVIPSGGVSIWVELDAPVSTALAHAALDEGVRLAPGPRFGVDGTLERFVRLPFTLPPADLVDAVRRLSSARAGLDRAHPAEWPSTALVA